MGMKMKVTFHSDRDSRCRKPLNYSGEEVVRSSAEDYEV